MSGLIFNSIKAIIVSEGMLDSFNRRPKEQNELSDIKLTKLNTLGANDIFTIRYFDGPKHNPFTLPNKVIRVADARYLHDAKVFLPVIAANDIGLPQHIAKTYILNLIQAKLDEGYRIEPSLNDVSCIAYLAEGYIHKKIIRLAIKRMVASEILSNEAGSYNENKVDWYVIDSRGLSAIHTEPMAVERIAGAAKLLESRLGQAYDGILYS